MGTVAGVTFITVLERSKKRVYSFKDACIARTEAVNEARFLLSRGASNPAFKRGRFSSVFKVACMLKELLVQTQLYGPLVVFDGDEGISEHFIRNPCAVWEDYNVDLFKKFTKAGDRVVDVGAYIGLHSIVLSELVGPTGQVLVFEGNKQVYGALEKNVGGRQNIQLVKAAVGSPEQRGKNVSLRDPVFTNLGGTGCFASDEGGSPNDTRFLCLDDLYEELRGLTLLKIDVEGNEACVIRGAERVLRDNNPFVVMEILGGYVPDIDPWDKREPTESDRIVLSVVQQMIDLGYSVCGRIEHDYYFKKF